MNSQSIEQVAVYAGKLLFNFKNCLLKANHDSASDSHFKYILDLTDKKLSNLARNVSVLRCLLTLICWTVVQIFFMILYQCLTERVWTFDMKSSTTFLQCFPKISASLDSYEITL